MPNGIFINVKDIMILRGFSTYQSARRHLVAIANDLKKPSIKSITVDEYCEVYKIKKDVVLRQLEAHFKKAK